MTNSPAYWLVLFSVNSWEEFLDTGGKIIGFNANKKRSAENLKPGDKLLCYLTRVSAFVATAEVADKAYVDHDPIWKEAVFPVRIPVVVTEKLPTAHAIQIKSLRNRLSIFKGLKNPNAWSMRASILPS